jgi:hypothetical protein
MMSSTGRSSKKPATAVSSEYIVRPTAMVRVAMDYYMYTTNAGFNQELPESIREA